MTLSEHIVATETRLADAKAKHEQLMQQMVTLNQQGIATEKDILGIEGELKALRMLQETS